MRATVPRPSASPSSSRALPSPADEPEPVDTGGTLPKAAEAIGLSFAQQLIPTTSGRRSLIRKETRS
jgi:hypothetical protein